MINHKYFTYLVTLCNDVLKTLRTNLQDLLICKQTIGKVILNVI